MFLIVVGLLHKFLEPNRSFTLKMDSDVRGPFVCPN